MAEKQPYQWDYDGACAPGPGNWMHNHTFSIGVFQWVPKASGKGLKRGKVMWRVRGYSSQPEEVYEKARVKCEALNKLKVPVADRDLHIIAAAVMCNGMIYRGRRHAQIMHDVWDAESAKKDWDGSPTRITQEMQGFVASDGKFYNRFQAGAIAYRAGQTKTRKQSLLSEDLW